MKNLKKYSDQDLIQELRTRQLAVSIWSIDDVNQAIDDLKEDEEDDFGGCDFSDKEKHKMIIDLFEDNDKSDDFDALRITIVEKWNTIKEKA